MDRGRRGKTVPSADYDPRKRYGIRDATPMAARSVTNYELAKTGGFVRPKPPRVVATKPEGWVCASVPVCKCNDAGDEFSCECQRKDGECTVCRAPIITVEKYERLRAGTALHFDTRSITSITKHPSNSRAFRCGCSRWHQWPRSSKPKRRVPEHERDVLCRCGVLHTR